MARCCSSGSSLVSTVAFCCCPLVRGCNCVGCSSIDFGAHLLSSSERGTNGPVCAVCCGVVRRSPIDGVWSDFQLEFDGSP